MQASYGAQAPTASRPLNGEPFPILTAAWLILLISPRVSNGAQPMLIALDEPL